MVSLILPFVLNLDLLIGVLLSILLLILLTHLDPSHTPHNLILMKIYRKNIILNINKPSFEREREKTDRKSSFNCDDHVKMHPS